MLSLVPSNDFFLWLSEHRWVSAKLSHIPRHLVAFLDLHQPRGTVSPLLFRRILLLLHFVFALLRSGHGQILTRDCCCRCYYPCKKVDSLFTFMVVSSIHVKSFQALQCFVEWIGLADRGCRHDSRSHLLILSSAAAGTVVKGWIDFKTFSFKVDMNWFTFTMYAKTLFELRTYVRGRPFDKLDGFLIKIQTLGHQSHHPSRTLAHESANDNSRINQWRPRSTPDAQLLALEKGPFSRDTGDATGGRVVSNPSPCRGLSLILQQHP